MHCANDLGELKGGEAGGEGEAEKTEGKKRGKGEGGVSKEGEGG